MLNIQQDEVELGRAMELHARGDVRGAHALCLRVLERSPGHTAALHLAGGLALATGDPRGAARMLERLVEAQPHGAMYLLDLGLAYRELGEYEAALAMHRRALAVSPDSVMIWMNLGVSLAQTGNLEESRLWLEKTAAAQPNDPQVLQNLATLYVDMSDYERALAICRRGLELDPRRVAILVAMQKAYTGMGRFAEAEGVLKRAEGIAPVAMVYKGMAHARTSAGEPEKALIAAERAVGLEPGNALYRFDRAVTLLTLGRYEEGFREYEYRRGLPEIRRAAPTLGGPEWGGEGLDGKRILLYTEQGFGDAIQFVRYVPMVVERGGRVILECQKELKRLFSRMEGVEQCVAAGESRPAFDVHCPLMSLGRIFGTTVETIPARGAYLKAEVSEEKKWREKVAANGGGLKVGLSWAGRPTHTNDRLRSVAAAELAELMRVPPPPRVRFYSLQKGVSAEAAAPLMEAGMIDWTGELKDFADTAGLVANLDLVITVDTAIAHLAGAMGIRTWVMVALAPDWRWGMGREDSRWYPSVRVFRQKAFRDWGSVVGRVKEELGRMTFGMQR